MQAANIANGKYSSENQRKAGSAPKPSMRKPFETPDGRFETLRQAANFFGLDKNTIRCRLLSDNYGDWQYV